MLLPRRACRRLSLATLLFLIFIWLFTPSDNVVLLAIRFNVGQLLAFFRGSGTARDAWLFKPARFPVAQEDIGLLIKTGFGTRRRVPALIDAYGLQVSQENQGFVIVGDFTPPVQVTGQPTVHDAIDGMMKDRSMSHWENAPRFIKYKHLAAAIEDGEEKRAEQIGKDFGWELDALKFIWGIRFAYDKLPQKKWYIIVDDDTYLIQPSLHLLLSHLDPNKAHYIGNAVGDFKGRFAHGGSAVILSAAAVQRLLNRPDVIDQAMVDSLTETWGDKLIATTLQKVGIYLDERHSHLFNGERPTTTRTMADRFCSPLLSFHGLSDPDEMRLIGIAFHSLPKPVFWSDLWTMYGAPEIMSFQKEPSRELQDHVGRTDERTMTLRDVLSADECLQQCETHAKRCLAWTWEQESKACHLAPWMIVGDKPAGKWSGVNFQQAQKLAMGCAA